jgi:hypothetical protein
VIVDSISKTLLATEITFCRLDAHVTEQEWDLLQLTTGLMTQTRIGPSQVVRRHLLKSIRRGGGLYYAPDHFRTEALHCNFSRLIDGPEDRPCRYLSCNQPCVHSSLDPRRHRYRPDVAAFADEIGNYPMLFSVLQISNHEPCQFCPTESETKQDRNIA